MGSFVPFSSIRITLYSITFSQDWINWTTGLVKFDNATCKYRNCQRNRVCWNDEEKGKFLSGITQKVVLFSPLVGGLTDPLGSIAVLSLTLTCLFNKVTILENNNNQRRVTIAASFSLTPLLTKYTVYSTWISNKFMYYNKCCIRRREARF